MKYFTADLHINHDNIIDYCDRPFKNVELMNEAIIKRFNERVKSEDTVYILGDFMFGNKEEREKFSSRLNGNLIFIEGNHDSKNTCPIFSMILKYGKDKKLCLCHNPIDRISTYDICIHGHIHNLYKHKVEDGVIYINAGVDVRNFYPVSIKEITEELNNMKIKKVK